MRKFKIGDIVIFKNEKGNSKCSIIEVNEDFRKVDYAVKDLNTGEILPAFEAKLKLYNEVIDKPNDKFELHKQLTEQLHDTYKRKNVAYGDSFGESFREFGVITAITRMSDKWNRIKSLVKGAKNDVPDESLLDSLMDLSNYALMTVMELKQDE